MTPKSARPKPDEPHVFDPMADIHVGFVDTGLVVGKTAAPLCQICRRPEKDRLHILNPDDKEAEHWG